VLNTAQQTIPLRENFDTAFDDWSIVSQGDADVWSALYPPTKKVR
jgi:hypothetical protein